MSRAVRASSEFEGRSGVARVSSEFDERVYAVTRKIPRGRVATYGEIALALGQPGAARAVGNALHRNPDPELTPCYRVVNARGELARNFGYGGSEEQKWRLEEDGIEVVEGKVDLEKWGCRVEELIG